MTTTLLLRIASVISLLFTVGHSLGGLNDWSPTGKTDTLRAMTDSHFEILGANRSYLDFFMGFGWSISVFMLLQTALLWQIASLARTDAAQMRPLIMMFGLAVLANAAIAWWFLFLLPVLFSGALLIVLLVAYVNAARRP